MHVNTQIRRGLERCIASNEAARLEGLYGMSGLSAVDNFNALEGLLEESGFSGAKGHVKLLRRRCDVVSDRMVKAVPVAKLAMQLMAENDSNLSGIFSKIGSALKKVVKVATKLSPSALVAKKLKIDKFSPSLLLANRVSSSPKTPPATAEQITAKAQAKADKKAAAAAAKLAKADAKAAAKKAKADAKAAAALARAGVQSGTAPVDAGAAVLANQAGVNLTTEQAAALAQQVAANIAQPGSTLPSASMFAPSDSGAPADAAAPASGPFGLSTPVLIGGAALLAGGLYLATRKKGRR